MKKRDIIMVVLMLFVSISTFAQVKITATADIKNAIEGSKPTNNEPALNINTAVRITDPYSGFTFSVDYEVFKAIEYKKFGAGIGKTFNSGKRWEYTTILQATQTLRYDYESAFISYGVLNYIDFKITDKVYVTLLCEVLKRRDIEVIWSDSNSIRLSLKAGITIKP